MDIIDETTFGLLFEREYASVARYAARRVLPAAVDDVVSEVFLAAWRQRANLSEPVRPWLLGTARRVVANELRREGRSSRLQRRLAAEDVSSATPDHSDTVADRVIVHVALAQLAERDQEALRLADWDRLSTGEAAAVLGCSVSAYKVRLHRARRRLARAIGHPPPPPGRDTSEAGNHPAIDRLPPRTDSEDHRAHTPG